MRMEDIRAISKVMLTLTSPVDDDTRTDAVIKQLCKLPLETLQVIDESEIHVETWLAVETMREEGETEEMVENRMPRTVTRELPEEGAFLRNKEEAKMLSNEKDSDKLDRCDWMETKIPIFKPDP